MSDTVETVEQRNIRVALLNIDARLPTLYKAQGTFNALLSMAKTADQRVGSDMAVTLIEGYIDMLVGLRKELTKT